LFFFTYPIARGVPGELEAILNSHPLALEHLVSSLMTFYVGKLFMYDVKVRLY
jgi:ubiquitin conjugation factor E4 B